MYDEEHSMKIFKVDRRVQDIDNRCVSVELNKDSFNRSVTEV